MKVALNTSHGRIVIDLNAEKSSKSVANFVEYVKKVQYDGTVFHRAAWTPT